MLQLSHANIFARFYYFKLMRQSSYAQWLISNATNL